MTERKIVDWEAIEREYRAGQCSVAEIGRRFDISHPAILKRAKRDGWTRNLAAKVREAVTAKLVTSEVTGAAGQRETIEAVAARVVQVVREAPYFDWPRSTARQGALRRTRRGDGEPRRNR